MKTVHTLNLHEILLIEDHATVMRVAGGWVYTIRATGSSVFVQYSKEFIPIKSEPVQSKIEVPSQTLEGIIEFWNSKKLPVCRNTNDKLEPELRKAIKNLGKDWRMLLKDSISNYSEVLNDKDYFFNTAWTLLKFITQKNAYMDFLNDGAKWIAYKNQKSKKESGGSFAGVGRV